MNAHDDGEDEIPTTMGRVDPSDQRDAEQTFPGFLVPDPEFASGWRYYYVKRPKPGAPPRRGIGFR